MDAEQRARELLAEAARHYGMGDFADAIMNGGDNKAVRICVRAITRALTQAQPGWRMVPVEPTEAMQAPSYMGEDGPNWPTRKAFYRAMLAAAPAPQQGEG